MSGKQDHNTVDPQGPTKTDSPPKLFFHRRVSFPNHFYLPLFPCPPLCLPPAALHQMGPSRTAATPAPSRQPEYSKVQPPRPPNAWILYRSHQFQMLRNNNPERLSQAEVSKRISFMWKHEGEDVKRLFEQRAEEEKLKHQQLYPDYRFCPQKKEDKLRSKEELKQGRRTKKTKTRGATPPDTNANANAPPPAPAMAPPSAMPRPYFFPGYPPNAILPQPYLLPYLPEVHLGPGRPSPPISTAPSPAPCENTASPESLLSLDENFASTSSSPSVPSSTSSGSRASSSSRSYTNQLYIPSLPGSHHPSPHPYATHSLPSLLFQSSVPSELPVSSSRSQPSSPANTNVPATLVWDDIHAHIQDFESHNPEVVKLDIGVNQPQKLDEFQQDDSGSASLESLLSSTDENGVFSLSTIDTSNLVVHPPGELEVSVAPPAPTVDYNGQLFVDLVDFEQQLASLTENDPSSSQVTASIQEDLESLFRLPDSSDVGTYTTPQRQPSLFSQDMMSFLNFEAADGSTEGAVSSVPAPTTVAPRELYLGNTQQAAATPIFTPMTNTSTVGSGASYVPPAGAIHWSTRRVAGSWKPSFAAVAPQTEDTIQPWFLSTH